MIEATRLDLYLRSKKVIDCQKVVDLPKRTKRHGYNYELAEDYLGRVGVLAG